MIIWLNNFFKSITIFVFSLSIIMGTNNSYSVKEIIINDEWFAEINNGEYVLNCRIGGMENDGETVILLHGFPETSYMWVGLMDL